MKTLAVTQGERITALETEVGYLRTDLADISTKLDSLISLRDKGAGAFWLGTTLFGTSLIGLAAVIASWFK